MKVINFKIENFMNIKSAFVEFDDKQNVVKIMGKNGAGKSAFLKGLWSLFEGPSAFPVEPITHGEDSGCLEANLGDITVTRRITKKENGKLSQTLVIKQANGFKASSPQTLLDTLYKKIALNPVAFINAGHKDRQRVLLDLTGREADLVALSEKRKGLFDNRTDVNREVKVLQTKVNALPQDDGSKEVSVSDLMHKLNDEQNRMLELAELQRESDDINREIDNTDASVVNFDAAIDRYRNEIKELETLISQAELEKVAAINNRRTLEKMASDSQKHIKEFPASNVDAIQEEISRADTDNIHARAVAEGRKLREELKDRKATADKLTKQIEQCDKDKAAILAESPLPANIDIDEDMIRIDGIAFDDRSTAEQIHTAVMVGLAQNPELKLVIIPRGESLDDDSMRVLEHVAEENDMTVVIESVSTETGGGIYIEDGCIMEGK